MLPRIRHNNFIGAVGLFIKSSYTKTHSNDFFNNIHRTSEKKDWILNYDSLLTLREFLRCTTQISKSGYQVFSSKNETIHAMNKFFISFSPKSNGTGHTMTLRGSGFGYEEIPITINEYNSSMDFRNREFPLEQNKRLYAWDVLQKRQPDTPKRIKGYIHQAIGDVSLGYALPEDIVNGLKRGKFGLRIPGGEAKECDG